MSGELNEGLLPCPFCGSIPEDNEFGTKVIHLSNECFLRDHEYSIEDWNVRAPSVSSEAADRAARRILEAHSLIKPTLSLWEERHMEIIAILTEELGQK